MSQNGNNGEYNEDEWIDDDSPVYRSLSIAAPASSEAQTFANSPFGGSQPMSESIQTYDDDDEPPVYRSLCVAAPPTTHTMGFAGMSVGSVPGAMHSFGSAGSFAQQPFSDMAPPAPKFQSEAIAAAADTSFDRLRLSEVPISASFLDPCHVFASSEIDPVEIAKQVTAELKAVDVDFIFKVQKAKWKCMAYEFGQHVDFRVRLYSCQGDQGYPLEFQRRQGPLLQFSKLYQKLIYKLSEAKIIRQDGGICRPTTIAPPPAIPLASAEVIDEGVQKLAQMAQSSMEDVKHQALVTMTKLSQKQEYHEPLLNQIDAMRACLSCSPHVRRCAVTILADLSQHHEQKVAAGLGVTQKGPRSEEVLRVLYGMVLGSNGADMESRRQSCRLLARLTKECDGTILMETASANKEMVVLVNNHGNSVLDERLKAHLTEVRAAFVARGLQV